MAISPIGTSYAEAARDRNDIDISVADGMPAPDERKEGSRKAQGRGVSLVRTALWLVRAERVERLQSWPPDAFDADAMVARMQSSYDIGNLAGWHRIAAAGAIGETVATVEAELGAFGLLMSGGFSTSFSNPIGALRCDPGKIAGHAVGIETDAVDVTRRQPFCEFGLV